MIRPFEMIFTRNRWWTNTFCMHEEVLEIHKEVVDSIRNYCLPPLLIAMNPCMQMLTPFARLYYENTVSFPHSQLSTIWDPESIRRLFVSSTDYFCNHSLCPYYELDHSLYFIRCSHPITWKPTSCNGLPLYANRVHGYSVYQVRPM